MEWGHGEVPGRPRFRKEARVGVAGSFGLLGEFGAVGGCAVCPGSGPDLVGHGPEPSPTTTVAITTPSPGGPPSYTSHFR